MLYNKKIFKRCFCERGSQFLKNFLHIPQYFKQLHYLIKNGFDQYATWEPYYWFITTMKQILTEYRDSMHGVPVVIPDFPALTSKNNKEYSIKVNENDQKWQEIINEMIDLLDQMDENNPKYADDSYRENLHKMKEEIDEAKDKFFALFAKYFYDLWD